MSQEKTLCTHEIFEEEGSIDITERRAASSTYSQVVMNRVNQC